MPSPPDARVSDPIVIVGAPRSGTNMLRDALTAIPGLATWPCDEINALWRHGNTRHPDDEIPPEQATPAVQEYLRRAFARLASRTGARRVVEKTCANSLRVAFVARVVPEARFVFLVRDGRDAVASAMKRWTSKLDLGYTLRKARFVPMTDVPRYAGRLVAARIYRLFHREKRLRSWGPRFQGMAEMLRSRTLAEVCAAQWARCVDLAERDLAPLSPRVYRLRYESFVAAPREEIGRLAAWLEEPLADGISAAIAAPVTSDNVGKWRSDLEPSVLEAALPWMDGTLKRHGYA